MSARTNMVAVGLAFLVVGVVLAGPFEDGKAAYDKGDYATAFRLWRPLAEQGDADAQTNLGTIYVLAQGVPQDYGEAVRWYRAAAAQGDPYAQGSLGYMYSYGLGVPQDYAEALKWYQVAAQQGDARAQLFLGLMYSLGNGTRPDRIEAHKWYNLALSRLPPGELRDLGVKARDASAKVMTRAQIAEAQKRAREWKPSP